MERVTTRRFLSRCYDAERRASDAKEASTRSAKRKDGIETGIKTERRATQTQFAVHVEGVLVNKVDDGDGNAKNGDGQEQAKIEALEEYAYHRAGQAVVCVTLFGARVVKHLALGADAADGDGFETYSRLPVPLSSRPASHRRGEERKPIAVEGIVDAHGVLAYSGIAALHAYLKGKGRAEAFDHQNAHLASREALSKLASSIGVERPTEHFYEEYWQEAQRLLDSHWEAVERVAEGLLKHRALNGNRVDALILGEELN